MLWNANLVLTGFFTVEVGLKLFGLGFWEFMRDGFNVFDLIVLTISYVEVGVGRGTVAGVLVSVLMCVYVTLWCICAAALMLYFLPYSLPGNITRACT